MPDPQARVGSVERVMNRHLVHGQPQGSRFKKDFGYQKQIRFISPNGWWASLVEDSKGIEVNMSPMTVAQFRQYAADIQDAVFVSAANAGHFPALWQGGGHINFDVAPFKSNPLLLRNLIVDFLNHNELALGIFNFDRVNATPHQFYPRESRLTGPDFVEEKWDLFTFTEFMKRTIRSLDSLWSQQQLTYESVVDRFTNLYVFGTSISLAKLSESRIEFRAVRPQASMDVFVRQISLLEARFRYLETISEPIPFKPLLTLRKQPEGHEHIPPVNPQAALRAFYQYVQESGQDWKDHRDYLWPQWITDGQLQKFEESAWFQAQEAKRRCATVLGD